MKLGFEEAQTAYESGSQRARSWTESWVRDQVFCPSCGNPSMTQFKANRPVADFHCLRCNEEYELKSQKNRFGAKVVDGAFKTMRARLSESNAPNFMFLNYNLQECAVRNLMVVPKHFVVPDVIEERRPLATTARRAGWIGCNILLDEIPRSGKIFIVRDGEIAERDNVLEQWRRTAFLREETGEAKGWLLEVMRCVEALGRPQFTLDEVYASEAKLSVLYPGNHNVRPKIRQQLQFLRDQGYLDFTSRGTYRLRTTG